MHVGLSRVAYERGDLPVVRRSRSARRRELGETALTPRGPPPVAGRDGTPARGRGRPADSHHPALDEAERVYVADFAPNLRPIPADTRAGCCPRPVKPLALAWARRSGLSADDDLTYLREYEHVTLAWVLLVEAVRHCRGGHLRRRRGFWTRLLEGRPRGSAAPGTVLEILRPAGPRRDAARVAPERALAALDRAVSASLKFRRVMSGCWPRRSSPLKAPALLC